VLVLVVVVVLLEVLVVEVVVVLVLVVLVLEVEVEVVSVVVGEVVGEVVGVVIAQSINKPDRCASIILFRTSAVSEHVVASRSLLKKQSMSCGVPPGPVNSLTALFSADDVSLHCAPSPKKMCSPSCEHCITPWLLGQACRILLRMPVSRWHAELLRKWVPYFSTHDIRP
jgi:hypothetical protein